MLSSMKLLDIYICVPACLVSAEERGEAMERLVFSPEDHFSLSLEYFDPQAEKDAVLRTAEDWEIASSRSSESGHEGATPTVEGAAAGPAKRYLQCPALFTVRLLKKFLRNKFELQPNYKIDVIHRRVCLPDDYTLMDVAYIYSWRQGAPMRFFYRIYRDPEQILTKKRPLPVSEPVSSQQESLPTPAKQERVEEKKETAIVKESSPPPREEKSMPPVQPVPENPPAIKVTEETKPSHEVRPPSRKEEVKPSSIEAVTPSGGENLVQGSKSSTSVECDKSQPVSTPTSVPEEKPAEVSPSSPSKGAAARPRPPGVNRGGQASILSIAQTLARKQQEQQQARQQREQSSSEPPQQQKAAAPAAALTPSENKEKFKPIQPKPAALPTDTPPQHVVAPPAQSQKRSYPTKKPPHSNSHEMIKQDSMKTPVVPKKPKLQEEILRQTLQSKPQQRSPPKQQSAARTRPSPTYPSMSPFAPMHRPPPHPIRIPAPPKQQQRPSSLSSSSSPSPSPPADVSPSSAARLYPQSNSAAATAAAILMQQQLELQSRFLHRPEWTHPLHHPAAFLPSAADWGHESMKRLENLMRSLGRGAAMFPYRPSMPNPAAAAAHAHAASHHAATAASHAAAARND
ncbi:hypothetical protein B566_EDAN004453 [Ephemera danica]|nr:hypothetical protein B566_EDAN004453 [Ephemera danica]